MASADSFRKQHDDILEIAGELGKQLYPELIEKGNEQVRKTAMQFDKEMGVLATTFYQAYMKKWCHKAAIEQAPDAFIDATQTLFDALTTRINRDA